MDVKRLQTHLSLLGYYPTRCRIDGIIGRYTKAGLRALQLDMIADGAIAPHLCDYRDSLDFEPTDAQAAIVESYYTNALAKRLPSLNAAPEKVSIPDALRGVDVPAQLVQAILHHESASGHWHAMLDPDGKAIWIPRYGVDYVGSDPRKPGADCVAPWIKSRGWGLGQITPPGDRSLPPRDHLVTGIPGRWPCWVTDWAANVRASCTILQVFRHDSKIKLECEGVGRYDCRWCRNCGHPKQCPWWAAARRYAGSGAGADRAVDEFCDVLRDLADGGGK